MCRGCGKDFCMRHANEHRQELGKQMDELAFDHDQFRQRLTEETIQSRYYSLMKEKIDQWEEQSIEKIRQAANDALKDLKNITEQYSTKLTEDLTRIAHEIDQAHKEDEYFETDVDEWIRQLSKLKNDLAKSSAFDIQYDKNIVSFISKICIDILQNEIFERSIGNVTLEDNDQVIRHGLPDGYATVREKGIISKDVFMEENSSNSPSIYDWAGPNQVYINGVYNSGYNKYHSDVQKNDIMELLIDCDQRTNSSDQLNVDLNNCPFPWQLNVIVYFLGDCIRFLSM